MVLIAGEERLGGSEQGRLHFLSLCWNKADNFLKTRALISRKHKTGGSSTGQSRHYVSRLRPLLPCDPTADWSSSHQQKLKECGCDTNHKKILEEFKLLLHQLT